MATYRGALGVLVGWLAVCGTGCVAMPTVAETVADRFDYVVPAATDARSAREAHRSLEHYQAHSENNVKAASAGRPVSSYGSTSAAYQRWVNDEVRELPDPLDTGIRLGGSD